MKAATAWASGAMAPPPTCPYAVSRTRGHASARRAALASVHPATVVTTPSPTSRASRSLARASTALAMAGKRAVATGTAMSAYGSWKKARAKVNRATVPLAPLPMTRTPRVSSCVRPR